MKVNDKVFVSVQPSDEELEFEISRSPKITKIFGSPWDFFVFVYGKTKD